MASDQNNHLGASDSNVDTVSGLSLPSCIQTHLFDSPMPSFSLRRLVQQRLDIPLECGRMVLQSPAVMSLLYCTYRRTLSGLSQYFWATRSMEEFSTSNLALKISERQELMMMP